MAVVYLCCVMFFLYIASTGAWALVNVVTPRHTVGTVGSMQNFGGYFAGSLAPVITGFLLEQTHSFKDALLMSASVAFAAAFFYFVLVRKPVQSP
jgi:cyanate permease